MTRLIAALLLLATVEASGQTPGNRPERLEWFRDLGFGIFIHWSVDSQIGSVISFRAVVKHPLITIYGEEQICPAR